MEAVSVVPFEEVIVRRCKLVTGESRKKRALSMIDVRVRRDFDSVRTSTFLNHNLHLVFSEGFPKKPYLSAPNAVAILERFDAVPVGGVHDLRQNVISKTGKLDAFALEVQNSAHAEKARWLVAEPNGRPVSLEANQATWRKFALAIDFARTNEELVGSFLEFLKTARDEYDLPPIEKSVRASRGGVPTWLTNRYAGESLNSLAAHRLIEAFNGDVNRAIGFLKSRKKTFLPLTRKEFLRTARRVPAVIQKLFGTAIEGNQWESFDEGTASSP